MGCEQRDLPADQTGREGERQNHHPRRHEGTGKADKTTIFADGLLIPTGVVPGDGGALRRQQHRTRVPLGDASPAAKPIKKKVVLSGFGTEDTHHIIHTFRWGPDWPALLQPVGVHPQPHRNADAA